MNTLIYIIGANVIISLFSLSGVLLIIWKKLLSKKIVPYLVAFAAGVILTTVFIDLFPEALEHTEELGRETNIFLPAFVGMVVSFFIERFLLWFHPHESTHGLKPSLLLITIGDTIHNYIDGVVIAAAFLANFQLGITATVAIAAHEIPQEIADFSILINSGLSRSKALVVNLISATAAIFGGVTGFYFLTLVQGGLPILLSLSSGIFIYISGSDLIPQLHTDFKKQKKWGQVIPFLLGIVIMYILINYLRFGH